MKAQHLPEQYKKYTLSLSDKSKYSISGLEKEGILNAPTQFLQLENGSVVNKNHIVAIHFEKEETTQDFRMLSTDKQDEILKSAVAISTT